MTLPPAKVGTWRYMAPEVVRHETWIASFKVVAVVSVVGEAVLYLIAFSMKI